MDLIITVEHPSILMAVHLAAADRDEDLHHLLALETKLQYNAWYEAKEAIGRWPLKPDKAGPKQGRPERLLELREKFSTTGATMMENSNFSKQRVATSRQCFQECPGISQVWRIKSLGEPVINLCQPVPSFRFPALP